ncbi:MAG: HEPN domain-containing protein [Planctomycetes bacterium]|nr:HEPN domain-containing protein [Planctomycetota bacterium]
MASRARDWLRQAERDLEVARTTFQAGQFDWSCFAAQQAAEKALKALHQTHHAEGWGHVLRTLAEGLLDREPVLSSLLEAAKILDKYYIPTRYPNGLDAGAPADAYTRTEAQQAIAHAESITRFCQARCGATR